jgi:hypothetical protein
MSDPYRPRAMTPDELIAAEVRAEMARQRITQKQMARDVFGTYPQFVHARVTGQVPFGAWELVRVADYLEVDVVVFLNAPKRQNPGPTISPGNIDFHGSASYGVRHLPTRGNTPLARAA